MAFFRAGLMAGPTSVTFGARRPVNPETLSKSVNSGNGMGQHYTDPDHLIVRRAVELVQETGAKQVLDLASGRGITALALGRETQARDILATDINLEGLSEIRDAAKAGNLPIRARFLNAGAEGIPNGFKNRFDVVIAKDLFPFLNPTQVSNFLKNASQALKPGGWFLVTAPSIRSRLFREAEVKNPKQNWYRKLGEEAKAFIQTSRSHFSFSSPAEMAKRLKRVGLEMTEAQHYGRAQGWFYAVAQKVDSTKITAASPARMLPAPAAK